MERSFPFVSAGCMVASGCLSMQLVSKTHLKVITPCRHIYQPHPFLKEERVRLGEGRFLQFWLAFFASRHSASFISSLLLNRRLEMKEVPKG